MLKKTLITLGLLAATTLSGCVVYGPRPVVCGPGVAVYGPRVFVPVIPVYGYYGGYYGGWGGGYHGRWR